MLRATGTFVKRDSTSSDAMVPCLSLDMRMSRNSAAELRLQAAGTKGVRIVHNFMAMLQVGVGICDMIGRSLFPGLCVYIFP